MATLYFKISTSSKVPKYKQIIDNVLKGLKQGKIKKGDLLPSINNVADKYSLSKDTVVKAYKQLKEK